MQGQGANSYVWLCTVCVMITTDTRLPELCVCVCECVSWLRRERWRASVCPLHGLAEAIWGCAFQTFLQTRTPAQAGMHLHPPRLLQKLSITKTHMQIQISCANTMMLGRMLAWRQSCHAQSFRGKLLCAR